MSDTKEAILETALSLFAQDGYEAVSVSRIAGALDMSKGALYKHYRNKRDIFDQIVARMEQRDAEQADKFELPEGTMEEMKEKYRNVSVEQFVKYCLAQFAYWTEDEFAASFRKMLTIEQFRNEEMQTLYQQYLVSGPAGYVGDLFEALGISNPEEKAIQLYATMFFFYSMYDGTPDKKGTRKKLEKMLEEKMKSICGDETGGGIISTTNR